MAIDGNPGDDRAARSDLVEELRRYARIDGITAGGGLSEDVLAAIGAVPRHLFVPDRYRSAAYANHPLPIGHGQTISQPYIVALMSDLLGVSAGDTVLEIGTGSGYQAAVLAEMGVVVRSIEIVEALADSADRRLSRLGYDTVTVRCGDGYAGWPEAAPFDGIIVTAAPDTVPRALIEQLKPGGRLVIPVGPSGGRQFLDVLTRTDDGGVDRERVIQVRFVPMISGDD